MHLFRSFKSHTLDWQLFQDRPGFIQPATVLRPLYRSTCICQHHRSRTRFTLLEKFINHVTVFAALRMHSMLHLCSLALVWRRFTDLSKRLSYRRTKWKKNIYRYHAVCSSLLPVLWCCWLGGRKGIWPIKTWVVGCWRGLSGVRCRLAYGPAGATATHCFLL